MVNLNNFVNTDVKALKKLIEKSAKINSGPKSNTEIKSVPKPVTDDTSNLCVTKEVRKLKKKLREIAILEKTMVDKTGELNEAQLLKLKSKQDIEKQLIQLKI